MREQNKKRFINFDKKLKAEKLVNECFSLLGIRLPIGTPRRYTDMMLELTQYQNTSNKEIADQINKVFPIEQKSDSKNMVIVKDIQTFSLCEHHIALMYDMKIDIGYIPNNFVLGLSKIVRASEMVCKRLQLQEKIGADILDVMSILTKSNDIAVQIEGKHSCITARGINNVNTKTVTTHFSGAFNKDEDLKKSFLNGLK